MQVKEEALIQDQNSSPKNMLKKGEDTKNFFEISRPYQTVLPSLVRNLQKSADIA
jgi:hypothetical protein